MFVVTLNAQESLVNFRHLDHLSERILFGGDTVQIVHVYANFPDYNWVDAKESGPEGIACVDDASRAAVLYLRHSELAQCSSCLEKARMLLKFILKMQDENGQFYNFILSDHTINRTGKTSFLSFGWWAGRGVWAFATGLRLFSQEDPGFATRLDKALLRSLPWIDTLLTSYGNVRTQGQYRIPQWLLHSSAADATSELLMGLTEYYATSPDPQTRVRIEKLAHGLMLMQDGDSLSYPFGVHRSWETMWHMWGNGQMQILAHAGKVIGDETMIASAERAARGFGARLLVDGFKKEMDIADSSKTSEYEQIAYAVRPLALGYVRLYEATRNTEYLKLAGLAASWFFGNNRLGQRMYDPRTGRCFDGISDSATINRNSGAESTIEALLTLSEVERFEEARRFLWHRKVRRGNAGRYRFAAFSFKGREEIVLAIHQDTGGLHIFEGNGAAEFLRATENNE